uniref:Uncharacterized protein n=1 Tax=Avena sativa TaxID=4498 RepID=A0ACD5YRL1_AVESA
MHHMDVSLGRTQVNAFERTQDISTHQSLLQSEGFGMSYTELILAAETNSQKQVSNDGFDSLFEEPMGLENKTFMIRERYSDQNIEYSNIETHEKEQVLENNYSDDEEQMGPEYCGFKGYDSDQPDEDIGGMFSEEETEPNVQSEVQPVDDETVVVIESNSALGSGIGASNIVDVEDVDDGTENLTQEDIKLYLASESVAAAERGSQEALSNHVPTINMIFDTDDQAYGFYNECNKSGPVLDKEVDEERRRKKQLRKQERTGCATPKASRQRRTNRIEITGCEAEMIITLKDSKWVVTNIELQNNHQLSPHDEIKFMRSHKHMTEQEKLYIRTFDSVNLPTRNIMAILTYLRGGKKRDVPYNKKCVSNVRTSIRNENNTNDMMQVLEYFRKRKADDPTFFYDFKLVDGNKVESIFWADGFSIKMYDLYGDCISFDTTYKTNKYNLPFAPFVGVTGHGHNCLFACAILHNETKDCFNWLFKTFEKCMGNKHPLTIITDQDVSMAQSIPACFPNSVHKNCFFHIKKKCQEKCGRVFATTPYLHAYFCDILQNSLTVSEFETLWQEMLVKYNVGHIKYFQDMWKYRTKFVPVYFKTAFFPFIHSTARKDIEEIEREQNLVTRNSEPKYWLHTELEYQAGRKYNRKIFYKFQNQMKFSTKLHVEEVEKHVRYEVYKSNMLAMKDFRSRRYVVLVNMMMQDFTCICGKFQKDGLLCGHVLRVLVHLNISELPEKYYKARWMPKERKEIRNIQFNVPRQLTQDNKHLRYSVLSRRLNDIASNGSKIDARYLMVLVDAEMIAEKLDKMAEEDELKEVQENRKGKQPVAAIDDGYRFLRDPDVAAPKGRPTGPGRQKTFMETLFSKQTITCSHCGDNDHNIATCWKLHIPQSEFQKKKPAKRKVAGSNKDSKQQGTDNKQDAKKPRITKAKKK